VHFRTVDTGELLQVLDVGRWLVVAAVDQVDGLAPRLQYRLGRARLRLSSRGRRTVTAAPEVPFRGF
jgi:hypothetical protein